MSMSTASSSLSPHRPTYPTKIQGARSQTSHRGSTSSVSSRAVEISAPHERIRVVSFPGTSQFRVHGVSACGLAAVNFARIAFRVIKASRTFPEALDTITSRQTVEEVISICGGWSSDLHLEVEDICKVPLFEHSLKRRSTFYGPPKSDHFRRVLREMQALRDSTAVIITRPPEIIACLKVANPLGKDAFIVFDSHPRPSHPDGAGLVIASTLDGAVTTLRDILHVDKDLLSLPDLQWEAQLLTNCSGHVLLARNETLNAEQSAIESSLAVLALRSEIKELEHHNKVLASQNEQLEDEVIELESTIQEERRRKTIGAATYAAAVSRSQQSWRSSFQTNAAAGPSRLSFNDRPQVYNGARSIFADNPPPVPVTKPMVYEAEEDALERMQLAFFEEDTRAAARDRNAAFQLQRKFDVEDKVLRQQQADLSCHAQARFKCGICLEEHPEDDAATVEDCRHEVCRSCLKDYVCSKIADHRFPILCPICTAENRQAGQISGLLVEQLGITEAEYGIWIEMELAQFSILIHCRKCNCTAFVDRTDYNDMPNIVCPVRDCSHVWCKLCHQTIVIGGPKHSCDGSSELDHLMKKQGWRYCPNCKTPIQKDHGCSHMMCIAPGCNTHFCYRCAKLIVRSALRDEISQAVTAHYAICQLFEVPE